jgi:hypothetical protein
VDKQRFPPSNPTVDPVIQRAGWNVPRLAAFERIKPELRIRC